MMSNATPNPFTLEEQNPFSTPHNASTHPSSATVVSQTQTETPPASRFEALLAATHQSHSDIYDVAHVPRHLSFCPHHSPSFLQLLKLLLKLLVSLVPTDLDALTTKKTHLSPQSQQTKACQEAQGKEGCSYINVEFPI